MATVPTRRRSVLTMRLRGAILRLHGRTPRRAAPIPHPLILIRRRATAILLLPTLPPHRATATPVAVVALMGAVVVVVAAHTVVVRTGIAKLFLSKAGPLRFVS
jgi:hypothetical protein